MTTPAPTTLPLATNWAKALIGIPWSPGGRGPETLDCWGLLKLVYLEQLNILLPDYPNLDPKSTLQVAQVFKQETRPGGIWEQIHRPTHLCAVGLSSNKKVHHVGIWIGGAMGHVLHSMDHVGVVLQSPVSLRGIGINNLSYYLHVPGNVH